MTNDILEYINKLEEENKQLREALEYSLWKLENTYEYIHLTYNWLTKETYRNTEEAKQFENAINKSKQSLKKATS